MKVIHFITSIDKSAGGPTVYMHLFSDELKKMVDLVVVTGTSPNATEIIGVKVHFLNLSLIRLITLKKKFRKLLEDEKPDIVHINGIWEPQIWLFQKAAQQLGIKVLLSPHGMLEPYILNRHSFKKKIGLVLYQRKALNNVDFLHATAKSELDQIRKLGYNQPACVIPNGIEISHAKEKTEWNNVQNILFLSRIHHKKGIEFLIEAVAKLQLSYLKITIAGEGSSTYIDSLKKLTVQRNVSNQFEFVGGIYGESKWELMQQSDLFVLSTYSENFGFVVPEALATGLPVITTTGTPWQELETFKCGWWIDLNVANLTRALTEAVNSTPDQLKTMGLQGKKLVKEKYEIKDLTEKLFSFYCQIL
ncbi:MAG: glycosyltransferase [Paludibacter sp.]|nr:glycosyltransferase [Paludibacter sp.]